MNAMISLAWVDLKLALRNVIATFFTFVFPVLMVLLFGAMYGNAPSSAGLPGAMDRAVPGYVVALVIGSAAFMGLPIELVSRRQSGVLRRFRLTPVPAWTPLVSLVVVNVVVCIAATVLALTIVAAINKQMQGLVLTIEGVVALVLMMVLVPRAQKAFPPAVAAAPPSPPATPAAPEVADAQEQTA